GLLRLGPRMRMVGIQKDREIVFIADTCNDGGDLTDADEGPLTLGSSDQSRHLKSASDCRNGIQSDEIGDVEMTYGCRFAGGFNQAIAKAFHRALPLAGLEANEQNQK